LSVALISPPSANRALPVRVYITAVWVLGGLLTFMWVGQTGEAERMLAWTYPTLVLMILALLVTVCNSDRLSPRVGRTMPSSGAGRGLAFVFFNGAAGGLVWVAGILAVTYIVTRAILLAPPKHGPSSGGNGHLFATSAAYAFAYALLGLFIQRKFLSKRPPKLAGLLAVLLASAWALLPNLVLFFLNKLSWKSIEGLQLGNPFNIFSLRNDTERLYHLYFAVGFLLIMVVLNANWFWQRLKNFRPPPASAPPVLE
jgi:hypothetical protein